LILAIAGDATEAPDRSFPSCLKTRETDMSHADKHNADNRGRVLRDLVENDPTFKAYKVVEVAESESGAKLTLVLVKKEVEGAGFLMSEPEIA
jgi:hypothetical protein